MENETRIALIGIIVEAMEATEQLNHILHDYSDFIIGRMGIPYREKGLGCPRRQNQFPGREAGADFRIKRKNHLF